MARNPKRLASVVTGLVLLLAVASGRADEAPQPPEDQQDLSRLALIWRGNSAEVKSAHIKYRSLLRSPTRFVTRDVVLKLLEKIDFVNRPDDARLLSQELGLNIPPDHEAWGYGELYDSGTKKRVNSDYEGYRHTETALIDAARIIADRRNMQINIHPRLGEKRSRTRLKSLAELRIIPNLKDPKTATIEKRLADALVVKIGARQFVVEGNTGFVRSVTIESPQIAEDVYQIGRVAHPGGITFPAAIITCRYVRGDLKSIAVDVIEAATFNQPMKDDVFAIGAPAGSKVFDSRLEKDDPGHYTTIKETVADVIAELGRK